jgi:hypothetical protein
LRTATLNDSFMDSWTPGTDKEYLDGRKRYRQKIAEIATKVRAKISGKTLVVGDQEMTPNYAKRAIAAVIVDRCAYMSTISNMINIVLRFTDHPEAFHANRGKKVRYFGAWSGRGDAGMAKSFIELIAHLAMVEDVMAKVVEQGAEG